MREFQTIYTRIGQAEVSQDSEDIIGTITLEFVDWKKRRKAREILAEAVERTKDLAGIHVNSRKQEAGPPIGKPVQIELSSKFPDILPPAIDKFRQKLESIDGLINVEDDLPLPGIDWQLKVDRAQAAKFGADIDLIGKAVQMVSTGIKMSEYRPDDSDDEVELRARYPRRYRTISELDNIRISTNEGLVPISNFVKRIAKQRTGTVRRSDSKRVFPSKPMSPKGCSSMTWLKLFVLGCLLQISTRVFVLSLKARMKSKTKQRHFSARLSALRCLLWRLFWLPSSTVFIPPSSS